MRKIFTKLFAISSITLLFTSSVFATDVIWPFTGSTLAPSTTTGTGFTAATATLSSASGFIAVKDYTTGKDAAGSAQVARISGTGTSATAMVTSFNTASDYIQFTLTATAGYNLDVSKIAFNLGYISSTVYAAMSYSLNGFSTKSDLVATGSKLTLINNANSPYLTNYQYTSTNFSGSTNITVPAGSTLSIRLYFYCTSSSTGKYIVVNNTTITFTSILLSTDPTISKSSGTTPASVMESYPLSPVVYSYVNVADDANVLSGWYTDKSCTTTATAPSGVSLDKNTTAKTITLSGTPVLTSAGKYFYKLTANETNGNSIIDSVIISPYVTPTPIVTPPSVANTQYVRAGETVASSIFTLSNCTNANVTGLPNGLTANFVAGSNNTGTLTVSGTVNSSEIPGDFVYTITPTPMSGYTGSEVTFKDTIGVRNSDAARVLYIALSTLTPSQDLLLSQFQTKLNYHVTKRAPINNPVPSNYNNYDLIVLHETLAGGDATTATNELSAIKSVDKPILNTKSFFYTYLTTASNRWGWGTPNSVGSPKGIKVIQPSHPIFNNITFTDSLYIYNTATAKNIQSTTAERIGGYNLAVAASNASGVAIHELPGSIRLGSGYTSKYLMISLLTGKYNDLTENALKLLDNAAQYLLTGTQFVAPSLQINSFTAVDIAGTIDNTVGASTIDVRVPIGTDRTAIIPVITLAGVGTTVTPSGAQNFTAGSINYTVTDGINTKVYAVSVLEQGTGLQNTLTGITFDGQTIQNNNHQMITVFDATGRLVITSDKDVTMNGYAKGIYMIRGEKGQLKIAYTK